LCRLLLGPSTPAAEDATGEVFLKAQRAIGSYDRKMPLVAWLLAIARNHCVDVLRRRSREGRLFAEEPVADDERLAAQVPSPLGELLASEERALVRRAVAELPERLRLALVLRYYEDLGNEEIGQVLGLTRQGAATLVFRARQQLRLRLHPAVLKEA
jgi:RNA polymerase sigma-70 factor (ECF subfamily)